MLLIGEEIKIYSPYSNALALKVTHGHFATNHSHINYYVDMTTLKVRQNEAQAMAKAMAADYMHTTIVDTIVCMDGCEIIGAYLAEELTHAGFLSMNHHQTIYIITPEFNTSSKLLFRDNTKPMLKDKHILLILASATTGKTIEQAIECIEYYGGMIQGVSSIFSAVTDIHGHAINSIFKSSDLVDYCTYPYDACPFCKSGMKIDAIVNGFGYSKLE